MFKDYNKYLSTSLKVYLFVLICIFILKLVGLDYFGIDIDKPIFTKIFMFLIEYKIVYIVQILLLYFNFYLVKSIILKNYKFDFETLLIPTIINIGIYIFYKYNCKELYQVYNILVMLIYFTLKKVKFSRIIKVFIINIIIQFISSVIRNYNTINYVVIVNLVMNIDYYIMLIIWYKLEKQGGVKICQNGQEVYSYLQQKMNLKNLLLKLQKNLHNFKKLDKKTKITYIIYFSLSLIWNTFSVIFVLFIAKLNNTFIECIFILTSFWLSKKSFGKAFHLSSMAQCFIVSNLTYYVLNRITTPLGVSILVPILLGVGLSYVTSKLVKKLYKPLYRGMPEELFNETILKVTDKNSDKYKICYDYFVLKKSAINLSMKYVYSEAGIRKIKDRVNEQIKPLFYLYQFVLFLFVKVKAKGANKRWKDYKRAMSLLLV